MLKLVGIGALGNMLSPAARHLTQANTVAKFTKILDRNPNDPTKQKQREEWIAHGAKLVNGYEDLIKGDNLDGVIICAGKNGDDLEIFTQVIPLIEQYYQFNQRPFIIHMSTVSVGFVQAAAGACQNHHINYANYPLTGGTKGAETANMLIFASGNQALFQKVAPLLTLLGKPKFYNEEVTTAAKIKLIGHVLVFNGLIGITSAIAAKVQSLDIDESTGDFFDFLNQGAGGTKQWDVALKQAINEGNWHNGFLLHHAVIDAIYTADFLLQNNLPSLTLFPILQVASIFSFLLNHFPEKNFATQSVLKALRETSNELDEFIAPLKSSKPSVFISRIIESLPKRLKNKVKLEVTAKDFKRPRNEVYE